MSPVPKPPPRPALRRAPDSSVHPAAAPGVTAFGADLELPGRAGAKGAKKGKRAPEPVKADPDALVDLVVPLPRGLRKRLRVKADEHGYTAEEAAYHLIRTWLGDQR